MTDTLKTINKYCYDEVLSLIQYGNDTKNWSPNNLKRLIISPTGVVAQYHVHKSTSRRVFDPTKYNVCVSTSDYKPMITALTDRVCSCVEEIVFCARGASGIMLNSRELELRSIIASYKNVGSEDALRSAIMTRFKRLRGIVILDMTINDFMQTEFNKCSGDEYHYCADESVRRSAMKVIDFHKDDWYLGRFLREQSYHLDREDGPLSNKFNNLQSKIEARKRANEVDKARDEYVGSLKDAFKKSETDTYRALLAVRNLVGLINTKEISCIYEVLGVQGSMVSCIEGLNFTSLNDASGLLSDKFRKIAGQYGIRITEEKMDAKQEIAELTKRLNNLKLRCYFGLCNKFLNMLCVVGKAYPIMLKTKLSTTDRRISIPSQLDELALQASQYFDSNLEGSSYMDSIANICWITCFILLNDSKDSNLRQFYDKNKWMEMMTNA